MSYGILNSLSCKVVKVEPPITEGTDNNNNNNNNKNNLKKNQVSFGGTDCWKQRKQ